DAPTHGDQHHLHSAHLHRGRVRDELPPHARAGLAPGIPGGDAVHGAAGRRHAPLVQTQGLDLTVHGRADGGTCAIDAPLPMDPIDAYFNSLPEPRRDALVQVHRLIARAWPRVVTDMSAGMPTYHLNGHAFCALADRKHCMVLHVAHYDLLAVFRHDLLKFDH